MFIRTLIGLSVLFVICGCTPQLNEYDKEIDAIIVPFDNDGELPTPPRPKPGPNKIISPSRVYNVYSDEDYKRCYKEVLESGLRFRKLKFFTADWCPSCKQVEPFILGLPKDYPNNVVFYFIHFDDIKNNQEKYSGLLRLKSLGTTEDNKTLIPHVRVKQLNFFGSDIRNSEQQIRGFLQEVQ